MEGVVLYVLLVKVFVEGSHKKYIIRFTLASYGKQACKLIMAIEENEMMFGLIMQVCQLFTCVLLFPWASC